jgi:hypothetical protein
LANASTARPHIAVYNGRLVDERFCLGRGFGVYYMSDAEARAAWTGEYIDEAQAAIDLESEVNTVKIRTGVNAVNLLTQAKR